MVRTVLQRAQAMHWFEVSHTLLMAVMRGWYMVFTKATSLAYMELYLTFANFFGRFDIKLWETDERCMEWVE